METVIGESLHGSMGELPDWVMLPGESFEIQGGFREKTQKTMSEHTWIGGEAGCRVIQTTATLQVSDMRTEEKHLDWQLKYCWFQWWDFRIVLK